MSNNNLIQYFEELKLSGIEQIFFDASQEARKSAVCSKCELSKTVTNIVFGHGNPKANLVIIGEAPGAKEDESGQPFVGRSGKLLTKMLLSIGIDRRDVFITNIVKCRPPGNRNPSDNEVAQCLPYLIKQLEKIRPRVILLLGKVASKSLLGVNDALKNLREAHYFYKKIPVFITYHPSALLRNPNWKKFAWIDLQKVQKFLNIQEKEHGR